MNASTQTYSVTLNEGFFSPRNMVDWLFAPFVAAGAPMRWPLIQPTWTFTRRQSCCYPSRLPSG